MGQMRNAYKVGFEVLTAVVTKSYIFWDKTMKYFG
jgi:hypothetical protein